MNPAAKPATLSFAQRNTLLDVLETAWQTRDQHATQLDAALSADGEQYEVLDDLPDFEARAAAVDRAYDDATAVDDLRAAIEDVQIIALDPMPATDTVSVISRALVEAWTAGSDVSEVVVQAVAEAQRTVFRSTDQWLTSHRSGSWEASYIDSILDSSGWDHEA